MHGDEVFCFQQAHGFDGFFGADVLGVHEPARRIGADGQHGKVNGSCAPADFGKAIEPSCIACVIQAQAAGFQDKAAPPAGIAICQAAAAPVLCRDEGDCYAAEGFFLPPADFCYVPESAPGKPGAQPLRNDIGRIWPQFFQGGRIHVVAVVVRDEDQIDFGQGRPCQARRAVSFYPAYFGGKHRINEDIFSGKLDEKGGVPYPGERVAAFFEQAAVIMDKGNGYAGSGRFAAFSFIQTEHPFQGFDELGMGKSLVRVGKAHVINGWAGRFYCTCFALPVLRVFKAGAFYAC